LLDGKIWEWYLSFRWEWEWGGNGMKSLKWEEFVTKNLLPHISTVNAVATAAYCHGCPQDFFHGWAN